MIQINDFKILIVAYPYKYQALLKTKKTLSERLKDWTPDAERHFIKFHKMAG